MSKLAGVIVIILSLAAGFGGGLVSNLIFGGKSSTETKTSASKSGSSTSTSSSSSKTTLKDCLTEIWGADKYAAISANPNLATTEDNLASLRCYKD